ncbi:MAG: peptidoglycan DD-metalloendopeptidase family protein [Patescibacteria group bacterium]|nr:peptidoglycan DD-metalloendopeptidase family protein [Patescibacteria group bacterium]
MRKPVLTITLLILAAAGVSAAVLFMRKPPTAGNRAVPAVSPTPIPDIIHAYTIQAGDTFGILAEQAGLPATTTQAILAAAEDIHTLTSITAGKPIRFIFDPSGSQLKSVEYEISTENFLRVTRDQAAWHAEKLPIDYTVKQATADGNISSSLYETMVEKGYDDRLAIALAEVFAWQVDFAVDVRTGDTFSVLYEQRYRDGKYVMPANILKATFTNAGQTYTAYYFASGTTTDGYFDAQGNSVLRMFLKSPLAYRYISSGYTGARRDPISKVMTAHYAIDYAASSGTPVVTVGDGTVTQAGWNDGYGISVTVRHNETYTTRYGHFSRLAKGIRAGAKVQQNQVIGYVGSTGHSTGPHLHYEMFKRGAKVNPFTVDIPAGKAVPENLREVFQTEVSRLDALFTAAQ